MQRAQVKIIFLLSEGPAVRTIVGAMTEIEQRRFRRRNR